jgi:antitoxin ParD1/3/4
MHKDTTVQLGAHLDAFIEMQVKSGRFNSASEVVQAALAMLEAEENRKNQMVAALVAGEESGLVDHFDSTVFLQEMQQKYGAATV